MGSWDEISDEAMNFEFAGAAPKKKVEAKGSDDDYQKTYYDRNKDRLSERAAARWRLDEGGYRERGLARARQKRSQQRTARAAEKFKTTLNNFRSGWHCRRCEHIEDGTRAAGGCPACGSQDLMQRIILVTVALCEKCDRTLPWQGEPRACEVDLPNGKTCRGTMVEGEKVLATKPPRLHAFETGEKWVYSSGTLAAMCGKNPSTIRTWIENRVVPGYSVKLSGRYWFTRSFMAAVAEGYRKTLYIDGRAPHKKLRRWVKAELEEQGIPYEPFNP